MLSLSFQIAWAIVVPLIVFFAALRLQGCVPAWIPAAMMVYSGVSFLSGVPSLMIAIGGGGSISTWGFVFGFISFLRFCASVWFAYALLELAGRVRHTAIQLGTSAEARSNASGETP